MALSDLTDISVAGNMVVSRLKQFLVPTGLISRRLEDRPRDSGDVVKVPTALTTHGTDITVRTKAAGSAYTADASEPAKVDVTLDTHRYAAVKWDAATHHTQMSAPAAVEAIVMDVAYSLAHDVYTDLWSNVTIANFPTAIFSDLPANFDYDALVDVWATTGIPTSFNRGVILNRLFYSQLLKDAKIAGHASVQSLAADATEEALVTRIAGMDIRFAEILPENAQDLAGVIVHPSALALAISPVTSKLAPGQGNLLDYRIFTDAETGLTITYRRIGDADVDQVKEIFEVLYGVAVLQAAALERFVDTTP